MIKNEKYIFCFVHDHNIMVMHKFEGDKEIFRYTFVL